MNKLLIKELEKIGWRYIETKYDYITFNKDFIDLSISFEYKEIIVEEEENPFDISHSRPLDFETFLVLSKFIKNN